jgi:hypothetical protein
MNIRNCVPYCSTVLAVNTLPTSNAGRRLPRLDAWREMTRTGEIPRAPARWPRGILRGLARRRVLVVILPTALERLPEAGEGPSGRIGGSCPVSCYRGGLGGAATPEPGATVRGFSGSWRSSGPRTTVHQPRARANAAHNSRLVVDPPTERAKRGRSPDGQMQSTTRATAVVSKEEPVRDERQWYAGQRQ